MLTVGVIGAGRFGTNFIKTFKELGAKVEWASAQSSKTIAKIRELDSGIKSTTDYKSILSDKNVEAIAIVTPAETHYKIAKDTLNSGKNLILEKPITTSLKECKELVAIAKKKKLKFMAGHIHMFNPGIQKLKKDIDSEAFGQIKSINHLHFGNGPVRRDINALWDFSPHTVSILNYLIDKLPTSVFASGVSFNGNGKEDIVNLTLHYEDGLYATSLMSWSNPFKTMKLEISGTKKFGIFNDHSVSDKLRYFNAHKISNNFHLEKKDQLQWDPICENIKISQDKPLTLELKHFMNCISENKSPMNSGEDIIKVTKVMECAQKSLDCRKEIKIK